MKLIHDRDAKPVIMGEYAFVTISEVQTPDLDVFVSGS